MSGLPRLPPVAAVHPPDAPVVDVAESPASAPRACGKTGEHHLLVVPSNREVESFRRMRPRDPLLRRPRVRPPVDEVPQAEDPVVFANLELGERPAKRREVSVDVAHHQVPAPRVPLKAAGEVRARRGEGLDLHIPPCRSSPATSTTVACIGLQLITPRRGASRPRSWRYPSSSSPSAVAAMPAPRARRPAPRRGRAPPRALSVRRVRRPAT